MLKQSADQPLENRLLVRIPHPADSFPFLLYILFTLNFHSVSVLRGVRAVKLYL